MLALSLLAVGCGDSAPAARGSAEAEPSAPDRIELTVLARQPVIGAPMFPVATENLIWVVDGHNDPALHAVDAETGRLTISVGRSGDGPQEFFRGAFGLIARPNDRVFAWDSGHQRLLEFAAAAPGEYDFRTVEFEGPVVQRVVEVDGKLVAQTGELGARFVVFDSSGVEAFRSDAPFLGDPAVDARTRARSTGSGAYQCEWPKRGFVEVNAYVGEIQFFDPRGSYVRSARVPDPSPPEFELVDGSARSKPPDQMQYVSCVVVEDQLLALYSGEPVGPSTDLNVALHGDQVHIFNWAGEFVRDVTLATPVRMLGYDPFRERLLATSLMDATIRVAAAGEFRER